MNSKSRCDGNMNLASSFADALQSRRRSLMAAGEFGDIRGFESVLLAIVGHDLRQPLQIIQSAHELLEMGLRTNAELAYLRSAQNAIDRIKDQLTQLMTAVRVQDQTTPMKLAPLRVEQVLIQACRENEETSIRKGVTLRMVSTDAVIESDCLLLGAALRNLVGNAVKFTEAGGRILVGCRRKGAFVRIDVCDTGIGISNEQLPKIFDAFTQVDAIRRDGLGIGLFIVSEVVKLLGHGIEVSSTPHRGSRFSILTPELRCIARH